MLANRVFITRRIPERGVEILAGRGCRVAVGQPDGDAAIERRAIVAGLDAADALICHLSERIDGELLATHGDLLGVANYAVGYDNIDVEAATRLGIPVTNTPEVLTETTADLAWALLLAVARRIPAAHRLVSEGRFKIWNPVLLLGDDVGPGGDGRPKVLGLIGYGRIGRAVARRAGGFGMQVLVNDPAGVNGEAGGPEPVSLDELLRRSDFVSIHAPLTEQTRHLIGARELGLMKRSAYLINTARGPIIDEEALVAALRDGTLRGAALDVYEHEPRLAAGLAALPNVVLAPHIGSASSATRSEMAAIVARNALAHLAGQRAPQVINPRVYDGAAWRERRARRRS